MCTGFVYALSVADKFVRSGQSRCALVVGAETYSRILDWTDRGTCVLFGDGAGAVLLRPAAEPGIYSSHLHADGAYRDILSVPGWVGGGKVTGKPLLQRNILRDSLHPIEVGRKTLQTYRKINGMQIKHILFPAIQGVTPAGRRVHDASSKR